MYRSAYRLFNLRPSSTPYLSGDGFRSLCGHFYESKTSNSFNARAVQENELVFCEASHLKEFLLGPARDVRTRFSIVSHNGDSNIDKSILDLLPIKLNRLFAQNVLVQNERVIPVPIGLENKRLHYNGIVSDFDALRRRKSEKKPRILSAFTLENNQRERAEARKYLSATLLNDRIDRINTRVYRRLAEAYMFIASPPGNGEDCHRTWEAMYLTSVPIVRRSPLTEHFQDLGLPLLVVSSYGEVSKLSEEELREIYRQNADRFFAPALWMDFWVEMIRRENREGR